MCDFVRRIRTKDVKNQTECATRAFSVDGRMLMVSSIARADYWTSGLWRTLLLACEVTPYDLVTMKPHFCLSHGGCRGASARAGSRRVPSAIRLQSSAIDSKLERLIPDDGVLVRRHDRGVVPGGGAKH